MGKYENNRSESNCKDQPLDVEIIVKFQHSDSLNNYVADYNYNAADGAVQKLLPESCALLT